MTSSYRRPPTQWSEGIVGIERCRSQFTGSGHGPTWWVDWLWTCNESGKQLVASLPRRVCIGPERARNDSPSMLQSLILTGVVRTGISQNRHETERHD